MLSAYGSNPTSLKDRTAEFQQLIAAQTSVNGQPSSQGAAAKTPKGEFARRAQAIGKDISDTTGKLGRLAQLARRKTLFDDRPVEISELTYIIKHDIAAINKQLSDLQSFNKQQKLQAGGGKGKGAEKADEHRGNVVTLLQTKLANATTSFQDILEVRTQNMKASRDRTEQFAYNGAPNGQLGTNSVLRSRNPVPPSRPDSPLYNPNRAGPAGTAVAHRTQPGGATAGGGANAVALDDDNGKNKGGEFLALDMGAAPTNGNQYMQMQLMDGGQDSYMQQRSTAIESIESTISELGQIFGQLAHMVAEQRDTVQRIDSDVYDVADNVSGAQRELLKYYASVSSNRWLMLKIFGVLIVFFLIFILVS
ncbi:t-SNARE [Meira miltonrushii]|uniref:t-SNARE n=1 Tax=Meira miltonrushii TaxID=1280837 RepID=A0A316VFL5_9BASI|nr:t-SNARE [Meira miltonrushii]PWN34791.1 t-SNARE [Meira miltonrushii]